LKLQLPTVLDFKDFKFPMADWFRVSLCISLPNYIVMA